jgi:hypothetical protein
LLIWCASPVTVYVCSASFEVLFFVFLGLIRSRTAIPGSRPPKRTREFFAGLAYVWKTKLILATISLDLFAVLVGGVTYLLPKFAEMLKVGSFGFGLLKAAPAAGAFVMAMLLAHRPPMRRAGRAMLLSVAGFSVATIVFGMSHWFWLSLLALFVTGALDNVSVVVRHTLVQMLTPDAMRGRVSAVNAVFIGASNELGGLESGLTAAWWGPVTAVVAGGFGSLAVVATVALLWPQIMKLGSLVDVRPAEEETARGTV